MFIELSLRRRPGRRPRRSFPLVLLSPSLTPSVALLFCRLCHFFVAFVAPPPGVSLPSPPLCIISMLPPPLPLFLAPYISSTQFLHLPIRSPWRQHPPHFAQIFVYRSLHFLGFTHAVSKGGETVFNDLRNCFFIIFFWVCVCVSLWFNHSPVHFYRSGKTLRV